MDVRSLLYALWVGGKAFLTTGGSGLAALVLYSFLLRDPVVNLTGAIQAIGAAAAFIGGYYGGRTARTLGWLHGGLTAASALVLLMGVQAWLFNSRPVLDPAGAVFAALFIGLGCLGGVAGINFSYARRADTRRRYPRANG